jgi:hypothetical protein
MYLCIHWGYCIRQGLKVSNENLGFWETEIDSSLLFKETSNGIFYLTIRVDNSVAERTDETIKEMKQEIKKFNGAKFQE